METVKEVMEQCKWLISKGRETEQAKLLLPRIAAKRRAQNKEKKTRVVFEADAETYAAFHAQLKRYRELCGNITIAQHILVDLLATMPDETILGLAEESKDSDFMMSRDKDNAL